MFYMGKSRERWRSRENPETRRYEERAERSDKGTRSLASSLRRPVGQLRKDTFFTEVPHPLIFEGYWRKI